MLDIRMKFLTSVLAAHAVRGALAYSDYPQPDAQGRYTLEAEGITAKFIPYGATLTNLFVKGES